MRHDLPRTPRWLLFAGVFTLVAGCSPAANEPASVTPASSSAFTSSPSAQDVTVDAATAATRRYYATTDELFQNAQLPIDGVATVADGEELEAVRSQLQAQRVRGEVQSGAVVVDRATATSADLGTPSSVTLDVCLDVSAVDVIGADGRSVLAADRPTQAQVTVTAVDAGERGWLVERTQASGSSCSAS